MYGQGSPQQIPGCRTATALLRPEHGLHTKLKLLHSSAVRRAWLCNSQTSSIDGLACRWQPATARKAQIRYSRPATVWQGNTACSKQKYLQQTLSGRRDGSSQVILGKCGLFLKARPGAKTPSTRPSLLITVCSWRVRSAGLLH